MITYGDAPRYSLESEFKTASISHTREIIATDTEHVPVVAVDFFLQTFLPTPPTAALDVIGSRPNQLFNKNGRLYGFAKDPATRGKTEGGAFCPLNMVFDRLVKLVQEKDISLHQTVRFVYEPNRQLTAGTTNSSKPDGYLQRIDGEETLRREEHPWEDIISVDEYKLCDEDETQEDDTKKVVYSGYHMLSNDPRRRFAFGVTIEDTDSRLWYFSRSFIVVSKSFNFTKNPAPLLRFYASLAFATDEELDYDSTIKRVKVGEDLQYEITVESTVYQTVRILSDFQAMCILGKANRTWQVMDKQSGDEFVLKDIWVVRGARGEHDIWNSFSTQVKRAHDKDDDAVLSKHFVPVETGWCVEEGKEAEDLPDAEVQGTLSTKFSVRKSQSLLNRCPATQPLGTVGHHDSDDDIFSPLPKLPVRRRRRSHWRVLYKSPPLTEFGRVKHMPTVVHTLIDTTKALQLLWKYGWVHRDVSSGNVYYDLKNKVGKISDYEYCKRYSISTLPSDDVGTGTKEFMAVEVAEGRYLLAARGTCSQDLTFHANPLHDLESTWWLLIWSMFSHIPESSDHSYDVQALTQQSAARKEVFFDPLTRRSCITSPAVFYKDYAPKLQPQFKTLAYGADEVLTTLHELYSKAEQSFPIPASAFETVHNTMMASMTKNLVEAAAALNDIKLARLGRVGKELLEQERKRNDEEKKRKLEEEGDQMVEQPRRGRRQRKKRKLR